MPDIVCTCIYEAYIDEPLSIWTTVLDFLFSAIIAVVAVNVNYKFLKQLQAEKRSRPIGRKGNVIEPVMQLFCKFQIIFWPYYLLYFWIHLNGIVPSSLMNGWWCNVILQVTIEFGRYYIGWISFFVALIRYIYIVHKETSNQWDYDRVGKLLKISSVVIPIVFYFIAFFVNPYKQYQKGEKFENCISDYVGSNSTINITSINGYPYAWTLQYIPENIMLGIYYSLTVVAVIVYLQLAEGFFYFEIYRTIKRYLLRFLC